MRENIDTYVDINAWRNGYRSGLLTFEEQSYICAKWVQMYPSQDHSNDAFVTDSIKLYSGDGPKRVVEFGGYEGHLYTRVAPHVDIQEWTSMEICAHNVIAGAPFREHVLTDFVFNEKPNIEGYDVFVTCHALEHLTGEDIQKTLAFFASGKIPLFILEAQYGQRGYTWDGVGGASHISEIDGNDTISIMTDLGYEALDVSDHNSTARSTAWTGVFRLIQ